MSVPMFVLRNGPKGARFVAFALSLCLFALLPSETGFQDLAALLARQPGVAERSHKHIITAFSASSFPTIQVAAFSFPRPVGTSIPRSGSYHLVSLDSEGSDLSGAMTRGSLQTNIRALWTKDFPVVDRTLKGDRLVLSTRPQDDGASDDANRLEDPATSNASVMGAKTAELTPATDSAPLDEELQAALQAPPLSQDVSQESALASGGGFSIATANLFFGNGAMGVTTRALERWQPGEEPVVVRPRAPVDTDLKNNASSPAKSGEDNRGGESIAGKGQAGAEPKRQKTPSERLGLEGKARAKAEKCLAEAVYFEARGEAVRGQIAVAQVVMNRVFSGFYPTTVCGVVYQNARRHLACQFTFACDDVTDVVREPDMWERAKKIAKATLDGRLWLPEVAKATHYHAYWVRPSWVHEMKKTYKYGVHTFYRPRAWGDGSEAPSWSNAAETAAIAAKL